MTLHRTKVALTLATVIMSRPPGGITHERCGINALTFRNTARRAGLMEDPIVYGLYRVTPEAVAWAEAVLTPLPKRVKTPKDLLRDKIARSTRWRM